MAWRRRPLQTCEEAEGSGARNAIALLLNPPPLCVSLQTIGALDEKKREALEKTWRKVGAAVEGAGAAGWLGQRSDHGLQTPLLPWGTPGVHRSKPTRSCAHYRSPPPFGQVDGDFGAIFGTLLPGTTAKLEPQEGRSFMEGAAWV